jgi:hypothetical protein
MKQAFLLAFLVVFSVGSLAETHVFNGQPYETIEETDLSIQEPVVVNGTLYVPRSYRMRNKRDPNMVERIFDYTVKTGTREVESTITNAIGRQIYEAGNKMGDVLGTW